MENFLEELNLQREATKRNIEKAFGVDIEKARSGVYSDTAENRKLNRVGQSYGSRKQEQPAAGSSEQKPEAGSRADIYNKLGDIEKVNISNVVKLVKRKLGDDIDANKIRLSRSKDTKSWNIKYDGKLVSISAPSAMEEDIAKKIGWLE